MHFDTLAGSEYGIVLLSTVRSREVPAGDVSADIGWIRTNLGFVADQHRICVGITRCKFGLVIVGMWTYSPVCLYFHITGIPVMHTISVPHSQVMQVC